MAQIKYLLITKLVLMEFMAQIIRFHFNHKALFNGIYGSIQFF